MCEEIISGNFPKHMEDITLQEQYIINHVTVKLPNEKIKNKS